MSQHYFISINGQQSGPFNFEELKAKKIKADTLIWTEGLDNWTRAGDIPLLFDILEKTTNTSNNQDHRQYSEGADNRNAGAEEDRYFGYKLAKKRERLLAAFIQEAPLQIIVCALFIEAIEKDGPFNFPTFIGTSIISLIIGAICYPRWSGNWGHKIMNIKVISATDGTDINTAKSGAARELLKNLSGYLLFPFIWLLWDKNHQNLYDKISNTLVVRKNEKNL